jgi:hypothetical protein
MSLDISCARSKVGRIHKLSVMVGVPHAVHVCPRTGKRYQVWRIAVQRSARRLATITISTKWTGGWLIPAVPDENKCHIPIEVETY